MYLDSVCNLFWDGIGSPHRFTSVFDDSTCWSHLNLHALWWNDGTPLNPEKGLDGACRWRTPTKKKIACDWGYCQYERSKTTLQLSQHGPAKQLIQVTFKCPTRVGLEAYPSHYTDRMYALLHTAKTTFALIFHHTTSLLRLCLPQYSNMLCGMPRSVSNFTRLYSYF